jgi:rubrerythrin
MTMARPKRTSRSLAGESQANRKYLAFAVQAERRSPGCGAALGARPRPDRNAHAHLRALGGVHDTAANLRAAVGGETHEFTSMYPRMIADADAENNRAASRSFRLASEVEQIHARLYQKALDTLGNNVETDYWVCDVCGNTVEGEPPDACPICGAKRPAFKKVD